MFSSLFFFFFFFFNDTATTEIYTLSLHDALPIYVAKSAETRFSVNLHCARRKRACTDLCGGRSAMVVPTATVDRKSTRLNSSHGYISYAVFCLKKKKKKSKK